jgi:hypothetical protein
MSTLPRPLAVVVSGVTLLLLAACAIALGWISLQRNFDRACDRNEWPYFSSCPKPDASVAAQVRDLRQRVARNPGDVTAYLALSLLTAQPGGIAPLDGEAVLAATRQLAPHDPRLLRVLTSRALQRGQWAEAAQSLVQLVDVHRDEAAARTLASFVAVPDARAALVAAMRPDSRWVMPLLRSMPAAQAQQAMPLVAQALSLRLMPSEMGLQIVSQLKATGQWQDAQALWLRLLGQPSALIYNGSFEQGFVRGGFDWDLQDAAASRTGVAVQQPSLAGAQGRALELSFNGRPLALPVMGQHLVLFPGRYAFAGRFMAQRLRAGTGLVWTFSCTAGGAELARTPPLTDTQGRWQDLSVPLEVPANCGAVLLQLKTQLGSDALAGLRGEAYFDAFALSAL